MTSRVISTAEPEGPEAPGALQQLDDRYGRKPTDTRRTRLILVIAGAVFAVVLVLWLVWVGLLGTPAQLDTQDRSHTVISPTEVEITWTITVPPGTDTSCALQALNDTFSIVGWKVVDIPASSDRHTRSFTESVQTSEQSVTGLIYRCWLS